MTVETDVRAVLSIRGLRKDRSQGGETPYSLQVPLFEVRPGEKLLITGPSGSGKSTLLDMLGMVLRPESAESFTFCPDAKNSRAASHDVAAAWRRNRVENLTMWRRRVGYVLQTGGLLPFASIRENINVARQLRGLDTAKNGTAVARLAENLGISHLLNKLPAQLSVGERQRTAIARALAAEPALVLADEPTAALDPHNAAGVLELFCRMVANLGTTLILVTHAPEQLAGMGFRTFSVRQEPQCGTGNVRGTVMKLVGPD